MFRVKIKADFLKSVVDATSILVDEVKLHVTPEELYARAVDPAHVGMIDFRLKADAFEEYGVKEDEEIAIDLEKLRAILKLPYTEDAILLSYEEEGRLVVQVGNLTRKMSLLDASGMTDTKIPSLDLATEILDLATEIVIKTSEISKGVRASEAVSDHIALSADPDGFELSAKGDTDTVTLKMPKSQLVSLKCTEKVRSLFSLDYFSDMIKSTKSDEIKLYLGNDYPATR